MTAASGPASQPQKNPTIVFAVSGEGDELSMDAVAIVEGKKLRDPFTDEQKDLQKAFGERYFATGRTYRLMFGGGEAGEVTLRKWSEGCNSIHAEVSAKTSARLGGEVKALATNSASIGKRPSARRAPTDSERSQVMTLVKSIYTNNRTPANQLASIKVTNLTATDLDGDGKFEMVGSFALTARNKFERDLFLIAKAQGAGMRSDFVKFQAYQPPPEGFLSGIDYVDQLDVDGDGIGEVFATQGGFDAYGYLVFRKTAGRWREIYRGIGDAC